MISVREAFDKVIGSIRPLDSEPIALTQATGRVLVTGLPARRTQPAAHLSAMDGYAVQSTDLTGGKVTLDVIGEITAGSDTTTPLKSGQAYRIYTGGVLPAGADQIIIQENTTRNGESITTAQPADIGAHIRLKGTDFEDKQQIMEKDRVITPKSMGLIAAAGYDKVMVHRPPNVIIITTGEEIVDAGKKDFALHETVDSASPMIESLLGDAGANILSVQHISDDKTALTHALTKAVNTAEIVMTVGGASVGERDYVKDAIKDAGGAIDFWKIAMRPGKPFLYGRKDDCVIIGLPGNAVSAFICSLLFARPLVDKMMGRPTPFPEGVLLPAAVDLPANGPRAHYMRARLVGSPGKRQVDPAALQDSSLVSVLAQSDGLIVRTPEAGACKAGNLVPFIPF